MENIWDEKILPSRDKKRMTNRTAKVECIKKKKERIASSPNIVQ